MNSNTNFQIEEAVISKISNIMGLEPIGLSITILKDVEISRTVSQQSKYYFHGRVEELIKVVGHS